MPPSAPGPLTVVDPSLATIHRRSGCPAGQSPLRSRSRRRRLRLGSIRPLPTPWPASRSSRWTSSRAPRPRRTPTYRQDHCAAIVIVASARGPAYRRLDRRVRDNPRGAGAARPPIIEAHRATTRRSTRTARAAADGQDPSTTVVLPDGQVERRTFDRTWRNMSDALGWATPCPSPHRLGGHLREREPPSPNGSLFKGTRDGRPDEHPGSRRAWNASGAPSSILQTDRAGCRPDGLPVRRSCIAVVVGARSGSSHAESDGASNQSSVHVSPSVTTVGRGPGDDEDSGLMGRRCFGGRTTGSPRGNPMPAPSTRRRRRLGRGGTPRPSAPSAAPPAAQCSTAGPQPSSRSRQSAFESAAFDSSPATGSGILRSTRDDSAPHERTDREPSCCEPAVHAWRRSGRSSERSSSDHVNRVPRRRDCASAESACRDADCPGACRRSVARAPLRGADGAPLPNRASLRAAARGSGARARHVLSYGRRLRRSRRRFARCPAGRGGSWVDVDPQGL